MIEATETLLFTSSYSCWNCGRAAPVAMIGAPAGARERRDDFEEIHDEAVLLSYILDLNYDALDILRSSGATIRADMSYAAGEGYLMNHCTHCDAKIGDHYLQQPGAPFFPVADEEFERVTTRKYVSPLKATASISVGVARQLVLRLLSK